MLQLEVVAVRHLLAHERILPNVANRLIMEFKNWASLQNPIIVDENNIVLDGNHRAHAFKELRFKYMPVCKIDYFNTSAKLRYWYRLFENFPDFEKLTAIIQSHGGRIRRVETREKLDLALSEETFSCGIHKQDFFAVFTFPGDIVHDAISAYEVVRKIEETLAGEGVDLKYIPCQATREEDFCDGLKADACIICTPKITKEMIVDASRQRQVFAPKTTRHLIPARPLNVNVPSLWFKDEVSLADINERFKQFLEAKQVKRFAPGQIINGRYYEEELFVFYSPEEGSRRHYQG
ncbi:MAG: ParB N-terminal domain-containing protein [Desulfobacteraceae bacterium]|nr:ParB N-terminal domain-containing protein [Desulfobacteraceae bacterium]